MVNVLKCVFLVGQVQVSLLPFGALWPWYVTYLGIWVGGMGYGVCVCESLSCMLAWFCVNGISVDQCWVRVYTCLSENREGRRGQQVHYSLRMAVIDSCWRRSGWLAAGWVWPQGCWGQRMDRWSARTAGTETSSLRLAAYDHWPSGCLSGTHANIRDAGMYTRADPI